MEQQKVYKAKYYAANKAKWRVYAAEWRKKNPEKSKAINKACRERNVEKQRARCAAWRAKNKQRVSEYNAAWREKNADLIKTKYAEVTTRCSKAWRSANPDAVNEMANRRRERKEASVAGADRRLIRSFYTIARRVSRCLGVEHHVDHIVPLFRGGPHHQDNLQILPGKINLRKGAKIAA